MKSYTNKKIVKFDNVIEQICTERKVSYVKMFDLLEVGDLADGLHPNAQGHAKICAQIFARCIL